MKGKIGISVALALATLFASHARAEDNPVVAVFEIDNRGPRLGKQTVENLSEYLSVLLTENGVRVVGYEQLRARMRALKKTPATCQDHACRCEVVREEGAKQYLTTQVLKIVDTCKVTAKLHNLDRPVAVRAASAGEGCDEKELLSALKQIVFRLAYVPEEQEKEEHTTLYFYKSGLHPDDRGEAPSDPAEKPEIGRLSLSSRPWGRVYIDGKDTGKSTPLVDYLLPIGKHRVDIFPPDKKRLTAEVEIWPGETTSLVVGADKTPAGKGELGWLSVNTRPWSEVILDGKHIGTTPLRQQLVPGTHEVKVTFAHGESKTSQVVVERGKTSRVVLSAADTESVHFGKNMGLLMVNSLPWGRVWVDGKDCGKATPLFNYQLPVGKHNITVYFSTGGMKTEAVDIKAGETTRKIFRGD